MIHPSQITLSEWRKAEGISLRKAAERLSAFLGRPIHGSNIFQWESGVMPGADVAEAIRAMTGGAVTGASFGRRPSSEG
jgi:hypothetical protein